MRKKTIEQLLMISNIQSMHPGIVDIEVVEVDKIESDDDLSD